MKLSFDVSCVQFAMRQCHNAKSDGNNRDRAENGELFQGYSGGRREMNVRLAQAHCLRFARWGQLRRGRLFEEFSKFLGRGLGHRSGT